MDKNLTVLHERNILLLKIIAVCFGLDVIINLLIDRSILLVILPVTMFIVMVISLLIYLKVWVKQTMYIIMVCAYLPFVFLIEMEPLIINYIFIWAAFIFTAIYQKVIPVIVSSCIANFLTVFYFFKFKEVIFAEIDSALVTYIVVFNLFLTIILILSRRFIENEIWSKNEYLESYFKNTSDAIVICDLSGSIVEVNESFEQLTGYEETEVKNFKIKLMEDQYLDEFITTVREMKNTKCSKTIETVIKCKNGGKCNLILTITPIKNRLGCNPNQLKQVFINIIKNGIESMPDGGKLTIQAWQDENNAVIIEMVDEGCGMTKETLTKIGTPFYTTKQDGTGLGMMVSHKIIESHNGTIDIDSEVNVGTKIKIRLPLKAMFGFKEQTDLA